MTSRKRYIFWTILILLLLAGVRMLIRYLDFASSEKARKEAKENAVRNKKIADSTITLVAVGDIMMGSNYPSETNCPPKDIHLLDPVATYLQAADLSFANLEGPVLDKGGKMKKCQDPSVCYAFRQPEYLTDQMKAAGIDLLSVANNHLGDFGEEGRSNTCRVLKEKGFRIAGQLTHPWDTITVKGLRVGFTAFAPNSGCLSINENETIERTVRELKSRCDIVIVSFHGGAEGSGYTHVKRKMETYVGERRGNVYAFARTAIDAGADVILGHGPHVPRAIDQYKGRFITYSMGNFCTYKQFGLGGAAGMAPLFELKIRRDGSFLEGKIISIKQVGEGGPIVDKERAAQKLIESLTKADLPERNFRMDSTGRFRF